MAEFHAITSVVTFITKYVTKVTNFVTIHIKCVINRTSVLFGETGGVFKKKFKKSSKVQKKFKSSKRVQKFREWNLVVNLIHICFEGEAASFCRSRNMGVYEKGILGVAFRSALLLDTFILISSKIPFK